MTTYDFRDYWPDKRTLVSDASALVDALRTSWLPPLRLGDLIPMVATEITDSALWGRLPDELRLEPDLIANCTLVGLDIAAQGNLPLAYSTGYLPRIHIADRLAADEHRKAVAAQRYEEWLEKSLLPAIGQGETLDESPRGKALALWNKMLFQHAHRPNGRLAVRQAIRAYNQSFDVGRTDPNQPDGFGDLNRSARAKGAADVVRMVFDNGAATKEVLGYEQGALILKRGGIKKALNEAIYDGKSKRRSRKRADELSLDATKGNDSDAGAPGLLDNEASPCHSPEEVYAMRGLRDLADNEFADARVRDLALMAHQDGSSPEESAGFLRSLNELLLQVDDPALRAEIVYQATAAGNRIDGWSRAEIASDYVSTVRQMEGCSGQAFTLLEAATA